MGDSIKSEWKRGWGRRVSKLKGRGKITDEKILELYKKGWFLRQIIYNYKVALKRLRRIVREYEMTGDDPAEIRAGEIPHDWGNGCVFKPVVIRQ